MTTPSLTRREFVASSVAAGAAASALPRLSHGFFAGGSDTVKIGLIGCGGRGTGAAVQAMRADEGVQLVSMGDVFADRLASSLEGINGAMGDKAKDRVQVPGSHQFVGFDSYKAVIDSGVDVVLITGYPHFRPEHVKAAVDAGKHVFAEKPIAVDGPGVRSFLQSAETAKQRNQALMVGFCWRHNAGMKAAFDRILAGDIGEVTSVYTTYLTSTLSKRPRKPEWSDLEFQMRNWWHFAWISGDHIVEQAVHSIDRLSWAMGDKLPQKVICLGGRAARSGPEHGDVYDHFSACFEYEGGIRCFHNTRQIDRCPSDNSDYVQGTKGSAVVEGWAPIYSLKSRKGDEIWKYSGEIPDMYQVEHNELFASIRAGKPINDAVRSANSCLMAIMARMAAYTGQTITWEQALNSAQRLGPEKYELTGALESPPVPIPGQTKFS
jgi:predicted dehydrogenase